MSDFKKFQHDLRVVPGQSPGKLSGLLLHNLEEMKQIIDNVSREWQEVPQDRNKRLLYVGSQLYDYYLLTENCLLQIARTFDRWAPTSLDWRSRLIKLVQNPAEDLRPAVVSEDTAAILFELLMHYQNFSNQSSTTFANRVEKLVSSIELFQDRFEEEIISFLKIFVR